MDPGDFAFNSNFRIFSDTAMDLDLQDELLFQGCWLETNDGFNFLEAQPSTSSDFYGTSPYLPFMGSGHTSIYPDHQIYQGELETFPENPSPVCPEIDDQIVETTTSPEESTWIPHRLEEQDKGTCVYVSWGCPKEEPPEEFQMTNHCDNNESDLYNKQVFMEFGKLQQNSGAKSSIDGGENSCIDQHPSAGTRNRGEKKKTKPEKTISLQVLQQYFPGSLKDAAKSVGVCPTTLKRICRQHGITRWPSRKIKKVGHSLRKLQLLVDSIQGPKDLIQIDSFYTTFPELSSPIFPGNGPFSSFKMSDNAKELIPQPESGLFNPEGTDSKSQFYSSNQSICFSTRAKQETSTSGLSIGQALMVEDRVEVPKITCSESDFQSLKTLVIPPLLQKCGGQNSQGGGTFRVKATFGEENIRFSLQPNWGFSDLQKAIAKRFNIDDFSRIDLKYLDNDSEQVLLTCDADLEECRDLLRFSGSHTIKIFLHQASQFKVGSSFLSVAEA